MASVVPPQPTPYEGPYTMPISPAAPRLPQRNILPPVILESIGENHANLSPLVSIPRNHKRVSMAMMVQKQGELVRVAQVNKSMMYCGKYASKVNPREHSVKLTIYKNKKYRVSGAAQTCGNKYCLHCGGRKQAQFVEKLQSFMVKARNNNMKVYFLTLTKNKDPDIQRSMSTARTAFSEVSKKCNDLQRTYGDVAIVGNIEASFGRKREHTSMGNRKTCHIHFHGLVAIPDTAALHIEKIQHGIEKAWHKGVSKGGGYTFTDEHLHDVVYKWVPVSTQQGIRELGRYLTKEMDGGKTEDITLGQELSSMTKNMTGRGLHELLKDICINNDQDDVAMYCEFMKAASGMKTIRSNRTYNRLAKEGAAIVSKIKEYDGSYTEDMMDRMEKDIASRYECQDIAGAYKLRTSLNEAISQSKRDGSYHEVGCALNDKIDTLSADIERYSQLCIDNNLTKIMEELDMERQRKEQYQDKVAGEISVAPSIWNAIAVRHSATYQLIDFYTEHYTEGKHTRLATAFTKWLHENREYHTEHPESKADKTMDDLDQFIHRIRKAMGT